MYFGGTFLPDMAFQTGHDLYIPDYASNAAVVCELNEVVGRWLTHVRLLADEFKASSGRLAQRRNVSMQSTMVDCSVKQFMEFDVSVLEDIRYWNHAYKVLEVIHQFDHPQVHPILAVLRHVGDDYEQRAEDFSSALAEVAKMKALCADASKYLGMIDSYCSAIEEGNIDVMAGMMPPLMYTLKVIWVASEAYGSSSKEDHERSTGVCRFIQLFCSLFALIKKALLGVFPPLQKQFGGEIVDPNPPSPAPTQQIRFRLVAVREVTLAWREAFKGTAQQVAEEPLLQPWTFDPEGLMEREMAYIDNRCSELAELAEQLFAHWRWYRHARQRGGVTAKADIKLEGMRELIVDYPHNAADSRRGGEWEEMQGAFLSQSSNFLSLTGVPPDVYWADPTYQAPVVSADPEPTSLKTVHTLELVDKLAATLSFNPPLLNILGPVMPSAIRRIAKSIPHRCSTTPGQGLLGSKKFDESDFELRTQNNGQTYYTAELPGAWCSESIGETNVMLALLDCLEAEGWSITESMGNMFESTCVYYFFFHKKKREA